MTRHRWALRIFIGGLVFILGSFFSEAARAGCGAPPPKLLLPIDGQDAPLNSKITVSLEQRDWIDRVVLRPMGGTPVGVSKTPLPSPVGLVLVQLSPDQPLAPRTQYELAIVGPPGNHPGTLIFGTFSTGGASDDAPPALRVDGAHYFEEENGVGSPLAWLEVGVGTEDGDRRGTKSLFAIWLPDAKGRLATNGPADFYVPQDGAVVRISSYDICSGWYVPLPAKLGSAEVGIAAIDEANNRSRTARVKVNFRRVEHRSRAR